MVFVVARNASGKAIGCGAVVVNSEYGELKRMYVHPQSRSLGVARKILTLLESSARASGCKLLKLETGPSQPEALRLYTSCGYERGGPFGKYTNDPLSVFMQKRVEA